MNWKLGIMYSWSELSAPFGGKHNSISFNQGYYCELLSFDSIYASVNSFSFLPSSLPSFFLFILYFWNSFFFLWIWFWKNNQSVCNINRLDNDDRPYCFTNEKNNSNDNDDIKKVQMFEFVSSEFFSFSETKCRTSSCFDCVTFIRRSASLC